MPAPVQEQAVPGTSVPSGAAISPGGDIGPQGTTGAPGVNAFTTTTAGFTVPTVGNTVVVPMTNASWMVPGEMVWIDQAGGGTGQPGIMQVASVAGNNATLMTPAMSGPI